MKTTEYLAKATEDGGGNVSTMRVIVLYGCLVGLTVIFSAWVGAMFSSRVAALAVPCSTAIGAIITTLLGLKLGQNAQENSNKP